MFKPFMMASRLFSYICLNYLFTQQCWSEFEAQLDGHVPEPGSERGKKFEEGIHLRNTFLYRYYCYTL